MRKKGRSSTCNVFLNERSSRKNSLCLMFISQLETDKQQQNAEITTLWYFPRVCFGFDHSQRIEIKLSTGLCLILAFTMMLSANSLLFFIWYSMSSGVYDWRCCEYMFLYTHLTKPLEILLEALLFFFVGTFCLT